MLPSFLIGIILIAGIYALCWWIARPKPFNRGE